MIFHPLALLIALPSIIAVFYLGWKVKRDDAKKRDPFTEPLLRPPGESCRQKLNVLYDDLQFRILWVVVPVFFATSVLYAPVTTGGYVVFTAISAGLTYVTLNRLLGIRKKIMSYQLGFEGERAVGQEINQTVSFGCKVYHDVQFVGYNIDHIIVSLTSGVYAIETKARRKGLGNDGYKFRYDGQKLIFPEGNNVKYLQQAERNAKDLDRQILKATGEKVSSVPILTLPGWFLDNSHYGEVYVNVLNPKWIVNFVRNRPGKQTLSEPQFKRITDWLDEKNRIT